MLIMGDYHGPLQAELREMESQDIIAKVIQPTDWVNSLVIREKENR